MSSKIWITRTQPGAKRLAVTLEAEGFEVLVAPVVEIESMTVEEPSDPPTLVIVVSEHAARCYVAQSWAAKSVRHIAIGESTSRALEGIGEIELPGAASSEGILAMPDIAALDTRDHVWIAAGSGGRDLLQDEIGKRAGVTKVELYRRVEIERDVSGETIDTIVASSGEAIAPIDRSWSEGRDVMLIVPSERVRLQAMERGFTNVVSADGADPTSILRALRR